ncbi:MAG: hypothetical protein ACYC5J_07005 [Chloroflexota bacterium]
MTTTFSRRRSLDVEPASEQERSGHRESDRIAQFAVDEDVTARIRDQRQFVDMVLQLVLEIQGRTAKEYARMALQDLGYRSAAQKISPEDSLATTLHQQFRKGHLSELKRVKEDGQWRYYKWDMAM